MVTFEDFTGIRYIPNRNKEVTLEILNEYISDYEPEWYIKVFGYEFQKEMLMDPSNPIYDIILNGGEYTVDGIMYKWNGTTGPSADYIYYKFIKGTIPSLTGTGYNIAESENSSYVQPVSKPGMVYNRMINDLQLLELYLSNNEDLYPKLNYSTFKKINEFNF